MPRKKLKTVRVHILLTEKQYASLSKLADKLGYSISELMRRAVDFFLGAEKQKREREKKTK